MDGVDRLNPRRLCRHLSLLALLIGAGSAGAQPVESVREVRLQLKWLHQFQFAGFYAAAAQGYYADAGLEVTFLENVPDQDPADVVLAGDAEFGLGTSGLLLHRAAGRPIVVLGVIFQHSPYVIVARQGDDLWTIHDLVGKRLLVEGSAEELLAYLHQERVPLDAIDIGPHEGDATALLEGRADAITAYTTTEPYFLEQAGFPYQVMDPRASGIDYYGDALFTTEDLLRTDESLVRAFTEASMRGWRYALDHPDEIIDLILSEYAPDADRAELEYQAREIARLMIPDMVPPGHMYEGRWRRIAEGYQEAGLIDEVSLDGFLYLPDQSPDLSRLYSVLSAILLLALIISAVLVRFHLLNRRLNEEMQERQRVAAELRSEVDFSLALIRSSADGIFVFDPELRITDWNPAMEAISGVESESALDGPVAAGLGRLALQDVSLFKNVLNGEVFAVTDHQIRTEDEGNRRFMDLLVSPIRNRTGEVVGGLGVLRDVTDRVRTAEFLRQELASQEQDLERLARDLAERSRELQATLEIAQSAKERAEDASQAKSRFLAAISHEFRAPLTAILGNADLLAADASIVMDDSHREQLETVRSSARDLSSMVDEILTIAGSETVEAQPRLQPIEIGPLVEAMIERHGPAAALKRLSLTVEPARDRLPPVSTDPVLVERILSHLIENAIRFTDEGDISVRILRDGAALAIQIEDMGFGLAPEHREWIFEPFTQIEPFHTRRVGGVGVGLTLARRHARALGGDVTWSARPERGSIFTLHLPMATPASRDHDPSVDPPSESIVLVVDDDAAVLNVMARALRKRGWQVDEASDTEQALDLLQRSAYRVLLSDISMPGRSGISLANEVRSRWPETAILLVSGAELDTPDTEHADRVSDAFMRKPFDLNDLVEEARNLLRISQGA